MWNACDKDVSFEDIKCKNICVRAGHAQKALKSREIARAKHNLKLSRDFHLH